MAGSVQKREILWKSRCIYSYFLSHRFIFGNHQHTLTGSISNTWVLLVQKLQRSTWWPRWLKSSLIYVYTIYTITQITGFVKVFIPPSKIYNTIVSNPISVTSLSDLATNYKNFSYTNLYPYWRLFSWETNLTTLIQSVFFSWHIFIKQRPS